MIRNNSALLLGAMFFILCFPAIQTFAEGYAFSGLNIDKLNVFWESSVADPTNLSQGPLRDGTGSQIDLSDLGPSGGGGSGGGRQIDLESTHATGTFATCYGT